MSVLLLLVSVAILAQAVDGFSVGLPLPVPDVMAVIVADRGSNCEIGCGFNTEAGGRVIYFIPGRAEVL